MTHLVSSSRMTSDLSRPSVAAFAPAAVHSSSSMRMLRSVVPLGMGECFRGVEGFRGADDAAVEGNAVHGFAVLHDVVVASVGFEHVDPAADVVPGVVHATSVPTRVGTSKGVTA